MRTWSRSLTISAGLAILLAALSLTCKPKSAKDTGAVKSEPNAPAESYAAKVAVTVNGVDIAAGEVDALIKPQLDTIARQSAQLAPAIADQYKKQLRQQALELLIRRQLLDQKIKEANIVVTEGEVIDQIRQITSGPGQQLSLEELKKQIEQYGQDFNDVKDDVRRALSRNKFMELQWAGKISVTEEEAKKYYDQNAKRFETPEQVRASHILVAFTPADPSLDPNQAKAKAKAKAEDLLKQIRNGADFAELAKAHSACPSAPNGGDLGFFPRGKTTPPFEKVAFELQVGQISDVVETEYGFHIIKVTDHKDAGVIPFEQAKDDIVKQLTAKKQSEFAEEYIDSLKAEANIVFPSQS